MIQLRTIRTYTPRGEQSERRFERPLSPDIVAPDVATLFKNLDSYIEQIEPKQRWNVFYTVGHSDGFEKRNWHSQDIIPFDIDNIVIAKDGSFDPRYVSLAFKALSVDPSKCVVVLSGNGLQILVQPMESITDQKFFKRNVLFYKLLLGKINVEYQKVGLTAKLDSSSFAHNRILRVPNTTNRKVGRPDTKARLIQGHLEAQDFVMHKILGMPPITDADHMEDKELKRFSVDVAAVEEGCDFLKWAKAEQNDLDEPQWYAALSIVGRLKTRDETEDDARKRVHEYSKNHASYDVGDTDQKLDQALAASGPRTCDNINKIWDGCKSCPNYKKVSSPICIKGEEFIATENTGFYMSGKNNALIPQYEDLRRFFEKEAPYRTHRKSGQTYVFQGKKYESWSLTELKNYAHEKFDPKPKDAYTTEFTSWINRTNIVGTEWFKTATVGKVNFSNGILDIATGEMSPHSPDHGFLYYLPYDYDQSATCPVFDKFLEDVTRSDKELQQILLEFVGYAACDQEYWLQKALLLVGEGSNGKSTFLKVAQDLVGKENVSFLSLSELQTVTERSSLEGKLLNVSDELPSYTFRNTEMFKKLLGGSMTARKLYQDSVMLENTTKFIFSCNDIPATNDVSHGLFRRLAIVPFNATFDLKTNGDSAIGAKMAAELPGIFNRVFEAYKKLKKRGRLVEAIESEKELQQYRDSVDRVGSWIKENMQWNCKYDDTMPFVKINDAFERYFTDAKRSEEKPVSKFHFTRHLRRQVENFDKRYGRKHEKGEKPYVLKGVWFNDGSGDTMDRY